MKIEAIKVFCDLAETGSFTETARRHGVTQSAVSQTIATLEGPLALRLFERGRKRGCQLTRAGESVFSYAKEALRGCLEFEKGLEKLRGQVCESIVVATTESIGLHELAGALRRLAEADPCTQVRVEYRRAKDVYEAVMGNVADLGVVTDPAENAGWRIVPVQRQRLVLICHPGNPLAQRKRMEARALNGQKFIGFEPGGRECTMAERMLNLHASTEKVMASESVELVKAGVEAGVGVALVPEATVRQEVASGVLAQVEVEELEVEEYFQVLAVIHRPGTELSPGMERFIAVLSEPV